MCQLQTSLTRGYSHATSKPYPLDNGHTEDQHIELSG